MHPYELLACFALISTPPPLHSNHPCIVIAEGGVTFRFANLRRRLYIELLRCICWLAKVVVLLVHCCALHASKVLHVPCIMQNTSVFHNFSHVFGRKKGTTRWDKSFVHGCR